jgi:hypothetical protein
MIHTQLTNRTTLSHRKLHNRPAVTRVTAESQVLAHAESVGQHLIRWIATNGHF